MVGGSSLRCEYAAPVRRTPVLLPKPAHNPCYLSPEPPATSPLLRHFSKMRFTCWCASSSACGALIRPVATLANIVGSTKVSNTSLSAGLAGPGYPMFVAHCKAVLIGLSLLGGVEPNGSLAVACSRQRRPAAGFGPRPVPA